MYTISELSLEEVNIILSGLGKLPLEVSHAVFSKIQQQVVPQVQAAGEMAEIKEEGV